MILYKDIDDRIIRINKYAADFLGVEEEAVEGLHSYELFPADPQAYYKNDMEIIKSGQAKMNYRTIIPVHTRGGIKTIDALISKIPHMDCCGNAIGLIIFLIPIEATEGSEDIPGD